MTRGKRRDAVLRKLANPKLTNVIAERQYQLVTRGGRKRKVVVRFGKPKTLPDRPHSYYCVYLIEGFEDELRPGFGVGVDGVQAIFQAMQTAWIELFASDAYKEGRLSYWGIPDLGLPRFELKVTKDQLTRRPRPSSPGQPVAAQAPTPTPTRARARARAPGRRRGA